MFRSASLAWLMVAVSVGSTLGSALAQQRAGNPKGECTSVRGTIEAERHAVISSEIAARIISIPSRDGDAFRKGDVIVGFDCDLYEAQLTSARADLSIATQTLASNRELAKRNAVSSFAVAVSAADEQRAAANVQAAQVNVNHCRIRAPYDGRVVSALVNENESVTPGSQLISIIDNSSAEIRLAMPSNTLQWIRPGIRFDFKPDEGVDSVAAAITTVGAHIDLINHSVLAIGRPNSPARTLISGMSGTATFCEVPQH